MEELLIVAAQEGQLDDIRVLLLRGAGIQHQDECGLTPLHHAAWNGQHDAAELLLSRGASVSTQSNFGSTPLHSAADKNQVRTVHLLISWGAFVNAQNKGGLTPLHYASTKDNTDTARVLLDKGAFVDAQDLEGRTPLHLASKHGCISVGCLLLDYGASPFTKDLEGNTPMDVAANQRTVTAFRLRATGGLEKMTPHKKDYVTQSVMQCLIRQNNNKKAEMSSRLDTDSQLEVIQKMVEKYEQEDIMRTTEMEEMKRFITEHGKKVEEQKMLKKSLEQIVAHSEKVDEEQVKRINELQAQLKLQQEKKKADQAKAFAAKLQYVRSN